MLNVIKNIWKREGLQQVSPSEAHQYTFVLHYKGTDIGTLQLIKGQWQFEYSDIYKKNPYLLPILDFPIKEAVYINYELWPIFSSRIPSLEHKPNIELMQKANVKPDDEAGLLRLFGRRALSNPYELIPC